MKLLELAAAVAELDRVLVYYSDIEPRLAAAMLQEIAAAKRFIRRYPLAWKPLPWGLRSITLHRFPYAIVYLPGADETLIVAYAHLRQSPQEGGDGEPCALGGG